MTHFPLSQEATAGLVGVCHAPEVVPRDATDPVVVGQPLVHDRVIGSDQVVDASVLPDQAVEEQLRLALHGVGELLVEVGELESVGVDLVQILKTEPLGSEPRAERLGARIHQHATHLLLQHHGIRESAQARQTHELLVGRRGPEEEGEAGGQVQIADPVRLGDVGRR
jgi:hypothetical protein